MTYLNDLQPGDSLDTLPREVRAAVSDIVRANLGTVIPALALTVVHEGRVRLNAAWGWVGAEGDEPQPARPDTRFDLASVSKLFTTTAFLRLAAARGLDLDAPLADIVPEFAAGPRPLDGGQDPHTRVSLPTPPELAGQTADPRRVTFRHLLTHTSGLAPWRAVFDAAGPPPPPPDQPDPLSRAARWARGLEALCRYPFVGQPDGTTVRYSDLGLLLLGEAVSRLHGTPSDLEAAVRAAVTEPLALDTVTYNPVRGGLARASVAPTEYDALWRGRRVWGEVHDENACGVGGVAGHAGLFAAARDVAALGQAWLDGDARLGIPPGLRHDAVQEHAETDGMRRGLGWMLKAHEGASAGDVLSAQTYGHTGFTGTSLWVDPARALVVACLTNNVYYGRLKPGLYEFRRALHTALAAPRIQLTGYSPARP
jgi:CubicO group peptidase (beta-lactamase class C family)